MYALARHLGSAPLCFSFAWQARDLLLTLTQSLSHTHSNTFTLTHSLSHTHSHTLTHTHSLSHTHSHTLTLTHTHSHTLTHTHSHTQTYSLTHTHTHSLTLSHFVASLMPQISMCADAGWQLCLDIGNSVALLLDSFD